MFTLSVTPIKISSSLPKWLSGLFLFSLIFPLQAAKNLFEPFATDSPFVLESFQQTPYRISYSGFVSEKNQIRYLFKQEKGGIFSLHPGETDQHVRFVQVSHDHQTVTLEDLQEHRTVTLTLGKKQYDPHRFTGVLRRKTDSKTFSFSEKPLQVDEKTVWLPIFHDPIFYLLEQKQGEEPIAYRIL